MAPYAWSQFPISRVSPSAETPTVCRLCADTSRALGERPEKAGAVLALGGDLDRSPLGECRRGNERKASKPAELLAFQSGTPRATRTAQITAAPSPRTESVLDARFGAATAQWGSFPWRHRPAGSGRRHHPEREFTRVTEGPGRCSSCGRSATVRISQPSDVAAHDRDPARGALRSVVRGPPARRAPPIRERAGSRTAPAPLGGWAAA